MKAKSRRRVLVSSVAMLLVAMLALGTATFAWFTTDTSTTASGIAAKTDKNSTIQVSSRTSDWTNHLNYSFDKTLSPISTADGKNWFYTVAEGPSEYTAAAAPKSGTFGKFGTGDSDTKPTVTAAQNYMFYNMLNVKNVGTADTTKDVHITATLSETLATTGKQYLRLALVPATATSDAGRATATVTDDGWVTANIHSYTAGDTANGVTAMNTSTGAITASTTATTTSGPSIDVNLGKLSANQAKYYMLIIWFEGQDEDCADINAGNALGELEFSIAEK